VINTSYRLVYPFLPVLARGLGIGPEAIIAAVTARSALGIGAPVLGGVADRIGRKPAILAGVAIFVAGGLIVAAYPSFTTLVLALLAGGLAKSLFDPSVHAFVGDQVAFERRGRPMAVIETGWSGAYLLGIPAVGLVIGAAGWVAPFWILAVLGLVCGLWIAASLPGGGSPAHRPSALFAGFFTIWTHPSAWGGLAVGLLISIGNEIVSIVYGLWMEQAFALRIAALGAATAVLGMAELSGEGLVAALADRLGKRRFVAAGILASSATAFALPLSAGSLPAALVALFAFYLAFEATVVGTIPLMSEQVPTARASLLATYFASLSVGRSLGAQAGAALFPMGMLANGAAAAALNLLSLVLLLGLVRERGG
jgi:predicted MFS family arabinose efflux permease